MREALARYRLYRRCGLPAAYAALRACGVPNMIVNILEGPWKTPS